MEKRSLLWRSRTQSVFPRAQCRVRRPLLRDPHDDMVLECAIACGANTVVTHNLKDFARARSQGVQAKTPRQFLKSLKGK